MAQDDDTPRKKRTGKSLAVWIMMGLLIAGLGAFGVSDFGGTVRSIGKVGDRSVDADTYARALRQRITQLSQQFGQPLTLSQVQAFGVDAQVLQSVLDQAALDNEADRIGLSVGDAVVAGELAKIQSFHALGGSFDREIYRMALQNNAMTESRFEADLRADLARSVLQGAVVGGFTAPQALTETLWSYVGEQRSFTLLPLSESDLDAPLGTPTDADLQAFYTTNIADFTRGEAKRITYAALLPDALAAAQTISDADVQAAYDDRIGEFVVPERRLVERLVYPSAEEAAAAKARLDAGETFETLVADRGLTLSDIDLGDVSIAELGAAGAAVFALPGPGVAGPLDTDLGPALFRMNAVLAAQNTTLEQARTDLLAALQLDAARRDISNRVEAIDDLLAGGASLEDLARDEGMTLGTTDYVPGAADNDAIAAYQAFAQVADAVAGGDFPEAILLDDGGLVALRLDETVPPTPVPFDAVRDRLTAAYSAQALTSALSAKAIQIKAAVEAGSTLESQGSVTQSTGIDRQGTVQGAPADVVVAVFDMAPGDLRVIEVPGYTAVLRLDAITPAAADGENATAMREAIRVQTEQGLAQDAFTLFTGALASEAGITLDQAAISAVNAQIN
jgi:peptidyl-prolyl cis-trans isomerase D